jgi:hypothetical protein
MLENPQTLRSYPEEQITQGTDRVSAPTVGDSNRRPGLAITLFAGRVMAETILTKSRPRL